jgi:hypothetical protein
VRHVALLSFRTFAFDLSRLLLCIQEGRQRSCLVSRHQPRTILLSLGQPSAAVLEREINYFWMMGSLFWSGRPSRQMTKDIMMESWQILPWRLGAMMMLLLR